MFVMYVITYVAPGVAGNCKRTRLVSLMRLLGGRKKMLVTAMFVPLDGGARSIVPAEYVINWGAGFSVLSGKKYSRRSSTVGWLVLNVPACTTNALPSL